MNQGDAHYRKLQELGRMIDAAVNEGGVIGVAPRVRFVLIMSEGQTIGRRRFNHVGNIDRRKLSGIVREFAGEIDFQDRMSGAVSRR